MTTLKLSHVSPLTFDYVLVSTRPNQTQSQTPHGKHKHSKRQRRASTNIVPRNDHHIAQRAVKSQQTDPYKPTQLHPHSQVGDAVGRWDLEKSMKGQLRCTRNLFFFFFSPTRRLQRLGIAESAKSFEAPASPNRLSPICPRCLNTHNIPTHTRTDHTACTATTTQQHTADHTTTHGHTTRLPRAQHTATHTHTHSH
jgi:hypothetical protein